MSPAELSANDVYEVCKSLARPGLPATGTKTLLGATAGSLASPEEALDELLASVGSEKLIVSENLLRQIVAALETTNVRLMGAPGTGKSTIAQLVLRAFKGDEYEFTLATGQWTGEDIIGGPVPDPEKPNTLTFEPGLVLSAADAGRWVGIDEINRADIDQAFGEMFSLLAGFDTRLPYRTKPGGDRVIVYAQRPAGELADWQFGLPEDWRMIATMNSWDKTSLARVSFAFSRRWCTVYVPIPDPDDYGKILGNAFEENPDADLESVREGCSRLFVEEGGTSVTLRGIGFALGPGIAVSVVRYLASCIRHGLTPAGAFLASVEGFVLPQFEGQLERHADISQALQGAADVAGVTEGQKVEMDRRLGVFTGATSSEVF